MKSYTFARISPRLTAIARPSVTEERAVRCPNLYIKFGFRRW